MLYYIPCSCEAVYTSKIDRLINTRVHQHQRGLCLPLFTKFAVAELHSGTGYQILFNSVSRYYVQRIIRKVTSTTLTIGWVTPLPSTWNIILVGCFGHLSSSINSYK